MNNKVRVSLSEDASNALITLMKHYNHSSPTHTANVVILNMIKQLSLSEEINDQRSTIHQL